jgi:hypothetical protein
MTLELDHTRGEVAIVEQIAAWAALGQSAPARLLGAAQGFVEWAHYPQPDALDPRSGWRFYYHAHPAQQRLRDEHGHFHIFVPGPGDKITDPAQDFSHLIGLSVSEKGLPLRLFTVNRWVTGEVWQPAAALEAYLDKPELQHAAPQDVALWLENLLILFGAEIKALIRARDARLGENPARKFEDHRLRLPSQARIDLARKLGG